MARMNLHDVSSLLLSTAEKDLDARYGFSEVFVKILDYNSVQINRGQIVFCSNVTVEWFSDCLELLSVITGFIDSHEEVSDGVFRVWVKNNRYLSAA